MMAELCAVGDSASKPVEAPALAAPEGEEVEMGFDFDEVMRSPHAKPASPKRVGTTADSPIGLALKGTRFASELLGRAVISAEDDVGSEKDLILVRSVLEALADAAGSTAASKLSAAPTLVEVVDSLDLLLGQLIRKELITMEELKPVEAGSRAAARHGKDLAMQVEEKRAAPPKPAETLVEGGGGLANLAKVIAASNLRPLSEKDEKVSEELSASQTRLERVCDDPEAATALACLAKLFESKESAVAQLEHYEKVSKSFPEVSDLIKSSHVRMPTGAGEFSALHPGAELTVKHARLVKTGLKAALKAITRKMVPAHADTSGVIAAAMAGALMSAADGSVAHLGAATNAKLYLGMLARPLSDKTANSRAEMLVLAHKAIPLLALMLAKAHPADTSIGLTMTDVHCLFGRGVAVRTVSETVEGLLVPLFRAYEEAFERFQKSATQVAPVLADVWAREQMAPTVLAFVSLIGTSEATRGSGGDDGTTEVSSKLAAAEKRLSELEKKLKKAPTTSPRAPAGDETPRGSSLTPADPNSKRSKEKAAKLLKEAADGANGGAAPSPAPAKP
jgi:hypothetical protein